MREKSIDYVAWEEGFFVHIPCGLTGKDEHVIQTLLSDGSLGISYAVIPETVGQYTGLKDKNGKRIFEGDIIKGENSRGKAVSVVKYGNYRPDMLTEAMDVAFGMRFKSDLYGLYAQERDGEQMVLPESTEYIEVIGTIHDNPELLEV